MLAEDAEQSLAWGNRALALATKLGDESVRAHALVNLGTIRAQLDGRDIAGLLEAHAVAHAAGDREEATRALGNLAYTLMCWVEPGPALRYGEEALAYAQEHEVHNFASYIATTLAWLRLRAGEWDEAERMTRREIEKGVTVSQLLAKTVLAELAVRRGDPDAAERLADVAAQAGRAGDPQRMMPVLELATEQALTSGTPMPTDRLERLVGEFRSSGGPTGWGASRVGAWAAVAGIEIASPPSTSTLFAAMRRRDWLGAADAFGEVGWLHDRALMLSLLDGEESLVEALGIARRLGAEPLSRRVTGRMRALRIRVPQGPREATRANPAGLTTRQLEVLTLLAEGLTNAEIAAHLVVSPRTAEHHVAAVLAKLGATTRWEAARRASELRLVDAR
jgi:DNA-binding CsgD family transcriptional regulator